MQRVGPHLDNLTGGGRRLIPGFHVNGDGDGNQNGGQDAGDHHVARALGEFLAAGGIVDFCWRILMK